jgi:hypothetical protein
MPYHVADVETFNSAAKVFILEVKDQHQNTYLNPVKLHNALNADGHICPVDLPVLVISYLLPAKLALYDAYCIKWDHKCRFALLL